MWFLNKDKPDNRMGLDLNVDEAWSLGYTGKGIIIGIIDDGVEYDHEDLKNNFDLKASIDLNDDDDDPRPR